MLGPVVGFAWRTVYTLRFTISESNDGMAHRSFYRTCLLLACLGLALLAGCGQKGDLYLPDEDAARRQR